MIFFFFLTVKIRFLDTFSLVLYARFVTENFNETNLRKKKELNDNNIFFRMFVNIVVVGVVPT